MSIYNGNFESWSRGTHFVSPVTTGIVVADGWYVGPGQGGRVEVSRRQIQLGGEPGLPALDEKGDPVRFVMRCKWLQSYAPTPGPGLWTTLIEHGEPYAGGSSGFGKPGVRIHAAKTIQPSIYAKVDQGPVAIQIRVWQSFGTGVGTSGDVEFGCTPFTVLESGVWTLISPTITLPNLDSKAISLDGTDYFGFGLDLSGGAAPGLELACASLIELP